MNYLQKVSVIMPVYNGERFLAEAVESVLAQTHAEFELLILDDGSTDRSLEILRRYEAGDSRVRVLSRENRGLCATLNELIELAACDLVFMMHADDVMAANRLQRQIAFFAEHPEVDICSSFVEYINDAGTVIGNYSSPLTTRQAVQELADQNEIVGFNHPATAFRRSVVRKVGGYRQPFWPCEDIDLWGRAVEAGAGICVIPDCLLKYRIHGTSASVARSTLLRRKHHYVKACMLARRAGLREPSWDEFGLAWARRPWFQKVNVWRKDAAKAFYKNAVFAYAQRRYFQVAGGLLAALMLQPVYIITQVFRKYGKHR